MSRSPRRNTGAANTSSTPSGRPRFGAAVPRSPARGEFGVLQTLLPADGAPVSAEEPLDRGWDEHLGPFSDVAEVAVGRCVASRR